MLFVVLKYIKGHQLCKISERKNITVYVHPFKSKPVFSISSREHVVSVVCMSSEHKANIYLPQREISITRNKYTS